MTHPLTVSDATREFCLEFERRIDALPTATCDPRYGPAHIVFEDYNLEDPHIDWCLADKSGYWQSLSPDEAAATRALLWWLKSVPLDIRCPEGHGCLCTVKCHGVSHGEAW